MIYFDNAATGGFKPESVVSAVCKTLRDLSVNAGRGSHRGALKALELITDTRIRAAEYFNIHLPENVIFTKNCTESLNLAILGTVKEGGEVIITSNAHNSVIRPLSELQRRGRISLKILYPQSPGASITAREIEHFITNRTYMVVVNHVSNVTGAMADLQSIGNLCKEHSIMLLCDAAQSAGQIDIDMQKYSINLLACAGHKGLYAPQGIGLLLINGANVNPIMFGGTGTDSHSMFQPSEYPESLESGTLNLPSIAGLNAGLKFLTENKSKLTSALSANYKLLIGMLLQNNKLRVYSTQNQCGIFSFLVHGYDSVETCEILSDKYDIAVRGGLHCAPLVHKHLSTLSTGLVRVSLSAFNTPAEIYTFVDAISAMSLN